MAPASELLALLPRLRASRAHSSSPDRSESGGYSTAGMPNVGRGAGWRRGPDEATATAEGERSRDDEGPEAEADESDREEEVEWAVEMDVVDEVDGARGGMSVDEEGSSSVAARDGTRGVRSSSAAPSKPG